MHCAAFYCRLDALGVVWICVWDLVVGFVGAVGCSLDLFAALIILMFLTLSFGVKLLMCCWVRVDCAL